MMIYLSAWAPAPHVVDHHGAPGCHLWPGLRPTIVTILGVDHWMEEHSLFVTLPFK